MRKAKAKKPTLKVAHFSLIKTMTGDVQILPALLEKPTRSSRRATAVIDSNGFGGISICSHRDKFDNQLGTLVALNYRDRAIEFHDKSGVKVIMAKNQEFPPKVARQKILEYLATANNENTEILDD